MNFQETLSSAIEWVDAQQSWVQLQGRPLTSEEVEWALAVGVQHPERVRVLEVEDFPKPAADALMPLLAEHGFLGPDMDGITYGHSILVRRGRVDRQLLSHELRHVYQYEAQGSPANFLEQYLSQVISFGYQNAPFEIDACNHELLA